MGAGVTIRPPPVPSVPCLWTTTCAPSGRASSPGRASPCGEIPRSLPNCCAISRFPRGGRSVVVQDYEGVGAQEVLGHVDEPGPQNDPQRQVWGGQRTCMVRAPPLLFASVRYARPPVPDPDFAQADGQLAVRNQSERLIPDAAALNDFRARRPCLPTGQAGEWPRSDGR